MQFYEFKSHEENVAASRLLMDWSLFTIYSDKYFFFIQIYNKIFCENKKTITELKLK